METKITNRAFVRELVSRLKKSGKKVVHCHGVFDLVHPGHVRHFKQAKEQGDCLVVSLTPDKFVNKGPGRPIFTESLRLEQIAALESVDYVFLNDTPDACRAIDAVEPDLYVKGEEYEDHGADVTGKISAEVEAVRAHGGEVFYTHDITFSSSSLLNRFFDKEMQRLAPFVSKVKEETSLDDLLKKIGAFSKMRVLLIGDAIIDQYQYVQMLGQSGKGQQVTTSLLDQETFLGGSLIMANHLANFVKEVTLFTGVGKTCPHREWIKNSLQQNVTAQFIDYEAPTLLKKRYVLKDGKSIQKLFETYTTHEALLDTAQTDEGLHFLNEHASEFDLVIVGDFGNGFLNSPLIAEIGDTSGFLAVNTQTNSGNRGYNVITQYPRADYISLNEPELRLAAHDRISDAAQVARDIAEMMQCKMLATTRGVAGVHMYPHDVEIPALVTTAIDRVGAGDSFFCLSSLAAASGYSPLIAGFLGSIAAAIDVQIVGNKEAITKVGLCKYLTRLMK